VQHDPALLRILSQPSPRTARRPWLGLLAALFELAQGKADLLRHSECSWASATFAGTKHCIALAFTGAEAQEVGERLISALPEHEFDLPGQLVADASIASVEQAMLPQPRMVVEIEVLLLEDG
jgi:hypothetical protein